MFILVIFCTVMHKISYAHNDLHQGNLGIVYTQDEFVQIGNIQIPTYGKKYVVLDYGTIVTR